MSRRSWTRKEIQTLAAMHKHCTYAQIAISLNRTVDSVCKKVGRLIAGKLDNKLNGWDVPAYHRENSWSAEEVDTLKAMYFSTDNRTIAKKLGRTPAALRVYANKLGLKKKPREREVKEIPYTPLPTFAIEGAFADVFMIPRPVVGSWLCSPLGRW